MAKKELTTESDPRDIENQIAFIELTLQKETNRFENLPPGSDIEIFNFNLQVTREIYNSLQELKKIRDEV